MELSGKKAGLLIGGLPFKFTTGRIVDRNQPYSTSNSEGLGFSESVDTISKVEVEFMQASLDFAAFNPWAGLTTLRAGFLVPVICFPDKADPGTFFSGTIRVTEGEWSIDVNGGEPFTFRGETVGVYFLPGEI